MMDTPAPIARLLDHPCTLLVTRICVTLPFLIAGIFKLTDWSSGVAEMESVGLRPAGLFNLLTLVTELGGSTLVIIDRRTWLGAGALGVFTVLTTFLAHRYWEFEGAARLQQFNSFLEHVTIAAAFILVTVLSVRSHHTKGLS